MRRRRMSGRLSRIFVVLLVTVVVVVVGSVGDGVAAAPGFVGCTFQPSICEVGELCFDDRLFGSCQPSNRLPDAFRYFPDGRQLHLLERQILRLVESGHTWDDLYTQCVLRSALLAIRSRRPYDPAFCDGFAARLVIDQSEEARRVVDQSEPRRVDQSETRRIDQSEEGREVDQSEALSRLQWMEAVLRRYVDQENEAREAAATLELEEEIEGREVLPPAATGGREDAESGRQVAPVDARGYARSRKRLESRPADYDDVARRARVNDDDVPPYDLADLSPYDLQILEGYMRAIGDADNAADADNVGDLDSGRGDDWKVNGMERNTLSDRETQYKDDSEILANLLIDGHSVDDLSPKQIDRLIAYVSSLLATKTDIGDDLSTPPRADLGPDWSDDDAPAETDQSQGQIEGPRKLRGEGASNMEQLNEAILLNARGNSKVSVKMAPVKKRIVKKKAGEEADVERNAILAVTPQRDYQFVETDYVYVTVTPRVSSPDVAEDLILHLQRFLFLPIGSFSEIKLDNDKINFRVNDNVLRLNGSTVADLARQLSHQLKNATGFSIVSTGNGHAGVEASVSEQRGEEPRVVVVTFVLCGVIAASVLVVIVVYTLRRHRLSRDKLAQLTGDGGPAMQTTDPSKDYQDLCRQHMQSQGGEKPELVHAATARVRSVSNSENRSPSSHSSTSSWSEEPVTSNMDISTGHIILSYMEDHLKNKDRLGEEWEALCAYEAEPNLTTIAVDPANIHKNRYTDILPYDHSRVVLNTATNASGSDYINASIITDHDPRNPAYIATQGPLPHTVSDFWQMVWEQGSVVIVNLTKMTENGVAMCHRYWPEEGSELYHIYEVHLVSEHIWCDDYLVRSFYLKNMQTNETRTLTQFHFITWSDLDVPASAKVLLDFRRKVNKSYRGRSCPILVHCSDGVGRAGTYCLLDMVLNRLIKGAKEVDIAATLEHIRDQRMLMAKTKGQFEFALASVAEEVHAILKALPQ